jgi:hypothetical protein
MTEWKDLVMYDNITFYYTCKKEIILTKEQKKEITKTLDDILYNKLYDGHISKIGLDMDSCFDKESCCEIGYKTGYAYNLASYPTPIPRTFPEDFFKIIPDNITVGDNIFTKKDFHAV